MRSGWRSGAGSRVSATGWRSDRRRGARLDPARRSEQDGRFVGLMMLPPAHGPDQPDDPGVADLGYRILRRYWRQGLATEASLALLRHAFTTVGVRRVIAQTMAVNAASRGVMEAVGMAYVRTYFPEWEDPLPGSERGRGGVRAHPRGLAAAGPATGGAAVVREEGRVRDRHRAANSRSTASA